MLKVFPLIVYIQAIEITTFVLPFYIIAVILGAGTYPLE